MRDQLDMSEAIKTLKVQMGAADLVPTEGASRSLDRLIARLSTDEFLRLRTLPAFWALMAMLEVPTETFAPTVLTDSEPETNPVEEYGSDTANVSTDLNPTLETQSSVVACDKYRLPHPHIPIGEVRLGGRYDKLIQRLCRSASRTVGVVTIECLEDILGMSEENLFKLDRVGKAYRDDWHQLRALYSRIPEAILPPQPEIHKFESIPELGRFVLEQLDNYLDGLDEKSQLIFQHRWGFIDEKKTLDQIGKEHGVSRERIRQLENKINERLNICMALDVDDIWETARNLTQEELCEQMPDLHACFPKQVHFHEFLTFISYGRIASMKSAERPLPNLLDDYFAKNGTVIALDLVLLQIQHCLRVDEKDAYNALCYLQAKGQIAITSEQVRPLNLGKHDAAAAVLSEHPNGLPWLDIVRLANRRSISSSQLSEQATGYALQDSSLMYVAGKGVYRHTRFINLEGIDETAIFSALHAFFASLSTEVSHLSEAYGDIPVLREHDYYIIRYFVKMRGEAHGIYFNGKSQTDSISLNPEFELYSQKSVILQSMRRRRTPMTKNEIAQLLKSRSLRHASVYITEMRLANQIVQVDRMLYTTLELAYENIDLDVERQAIESVLRLHDKPVDPSVLQAELNLRQGYTYSKQFYGSLARYFTQLQHWHRRQSLFALEPIPFASLTEAIDTLCGVDTSIESNVAILRTHIAITEEAAKVSIYNWKAAKVRLETGASINEAEDEMEND